MEELTSVRQAVRQICARYDGSYWQGLERDGGRYPEDFIRELTESGWLGLLIPEEYGGGGAGVTEAGVVLEEIHRSGANANACHAQMYTMGVLLHHGSEEQKRRYLPEIASGKLRLQAFAVTEPDAGSDTSRIRTRAVRTDDGFVVNGQKIYISRVAYSDLMILLARTSDAPEGRGTQGLSIFLVDLREAGDAVTLQRIPMTFNHHTYQVFINDLRLPHDALVGEIDNGFRHIIDGWNVERILVSSEAIGDARFFVDRATEYAKQRQVFGRPIGMNQGVQFPLAQASAHLEAADLMRFEAARRFDAGEKCGPQANMAKLLASQASWEAANAAVTTYGATASLSSTTSNGSSARRSCSRSPL
ncbi:acyl-CoA dehydrogenase family protein [Blastococcus brunescens]|uniref:Acyl-CoA dehydrogenase family protein n=1 Tax=Blastococcus brunescens TaxID=1564165 RepID=A0ABZ1B2M7_9ACTN|nr:acyl-CoA dehydrogenase family protein [Blastococcus sp. BMG 8361]WRL63604.1 acyl-CoA dehydrogenase family protein [Blastococcus sp. BMG 8361]